ncbi:trypsin-like peptidase domain-containing protein [Streptomyces sp. NBC_00893]|uniref:nSTAND1 domain-containing NTPase n=1 Tax=Streptomyces sp. NBC_00893 TaxID=2975862 RepID=UPI0022526590|nr:trypsin-like peptidase domain-containing protein [Streptomyces sp. NBC_00893]MCX4851395.1 trypsin-like peptidase domain-containing protein [Streptomyces sp. NBC_00893]MCX4851818.1 trypsin-like peptidase domain-containing protein [Streptomyces sp. NBC_00893]
MASVRGNDALESSQVRICSAAGEVVGAGFLIAADVVCTCAHVVARALGIADERVPNKPVDLDFPLLGGRPPARATVVSWRRGGADVALLRLDGAIEGARPVPLVDGTDVWGHTFRAFGYPAGADGGVWASGTLRAGQGSGWVQMEAQEPGPRIVGGFSGSPVWDDLQDGVVGMTVAAHRGERTAYLLPSAGLIDEEIVRPRCPFQGLAAFAEDDAEFFHGRDSDTARVHTAVRRRPVTLLTGPSGCGKSSLVRAGLLPRLRAEGISVSELRPVPGVRASAVLARTLTGILEPGLSEVERLTRAEELAGLLEAGGDVPAELRGRVLAHGEGAGHILFVDQLEEYAAAEPAAARDLFGLLAALAGKGTGALRVVATTRLDSLDVLVTAGTSDLVSDAVQFLAPLAGDELEQAVTAPVDAVPGLWFEPGLAERIVADAGDEPGRMPLVQFTLTELWNRRTRSMLTHAAYDEVGGVAGALVGYADDALAGLSRDQQDCARRLFVQLARPGDGDVFFRRPSRTADLAPELVELARELATGKLVVLSHAPGSGENEEIVDLVHEALTRLWPRLRQWLADSRDFRLWQEQLRADLRRWQEQHREPARLLTGTDLAEADRRLTEHPRDISADERRYIQLSRRHSRRGTRVRQAAVGALAVLTVLAVVLALTTFQSLRRTEQQLRTQAAGILAQAAEDRPLSDPTTALQLTLAGWKTKQTDKTRQALLSQYARGQYLVGSYPSLWRGRYLGMDATPDGRTLFVRSNTAGARLTITVITGALDGKPRTHKLSGVPEGDLLTAASPDGRFFAAISEPGSGVRLWRLSDLKQPIVLDHANREFPEKVGGHLDFSSDGERLLLTSNDNSRQCSDAPQKCTPAFAEAWQVPSGAPIRTAEDLLPDKGLSQAAFTSDPDTVAIVRRIAVKRGESTRRIELKDLATGRVNDQFTLPSDDYNDAELRAGGELLLTRDSADSATYTRTLGRTIGQKTKIPPVDSATDATGNHGLRAEIDVPEDGGYSEKRLTDLRSGRSYRTRVPTAGGDTDALAAAPRAGGELTVLVPVGTALMAVRAEAAGGEEFTGDGDGETFSKSPDGRFIARVADRYLEVLGVTRNRHAQVSLPAGDWKTSWTADSRRIVVWGEDGSLYRSFSVPDLKDSVPLGNTAPKAKVLDDVAPLEGSEIALLAKDGSLTRVDAADGTLLTRPFLVHPAPNFNDDPDKLIFADRNQLLARPGHPGQVAVATRTGGRNGEVLLWDILGRRRLAVLTGSPIYLPLTPTTHTGSFAFDADGTHLAVSVEGVQVDVWDVDRKKQLEGGAHAVSGHLVGFGPGGSVVTYDSMKGKVAIHGLTRDKVTAPLTVPVQGGDGAMSSVHGDRLTVDSYFVSQTINLNPDTQFRTLCAAAGRDYTPAERKLLPEGTPSNPPCA